MKNKNVAFCVVLDSSFSTFSRCKLDSYKRTGIEKEAYFKIQQPTRSSQFLVFTELYMVVCNIGKLTQDIEVNEGSQAVRRQVSEPRSALENFLEFKENLGHALHYIARVYRAASETYWK